MNPEEPTLISIQQVCRVLKINKQQALDKLDRVCIPRIDAQGQIVLSVDEFQQLLEVR